MSINRTTVLRHASAVVLLGVAWNRLSAWYAFQHSRDYLTFAVCFVAAAGIASCESFRSHLAGTSRLRASLTAGVLLLALPWSEWFQAALPSAREDWSRQLFLQSCFLYAGLTMFHWLPRARLYLKDRVLNLLDRVSAPRVFPWILVFLFFCFTSWIAIFAFQKILVIQDAAAHMFQAKIFRAGHLYAPAPPVPEAFNRMGDMLVLRDGRWFSSYLPGFSLLLAAAMLFRMEWLVGPALGAATIALWIAYARRWHDRRIAFLTGLLCLLSPTFSLMHASMMVHAAELLIVSAAIYLCRRESEEPSGTRLVLLGLTLTAGAVTRGFSILPFVAPALAYTALHRKGRLTFAAVVSAAVLCGVILVGLYQWKTTGHPLLAAYDLEYDRPIPFGFHGEILGQKHTPLRGLENTSNNLLGMNSWLTGWPAGALFFLIVFAWKEKKKDSWDTILLLSCLVLAAFYYFIVFQDLVRGPRYWFPMVPVLILFIARGILITDTRIRSYTVPISVVAFAVYLVFYLPGILRKYSPVPTQAGQLHAEMEKAGDAKLLIFLDRHTTQQLVNWNDPFFRNNIVLCSDRGAANGEVVRSFAAYRPVYFRESQSLEKSQLTSGFKLMDTPDPDPPGYLSLFNFALMIQSANSYTDVDLFDLSYTQFMAADSAEETLDYLMRLQPQKGDEPRVRKQLRSGLIHTARMVLLPKYAFEERKRGWMEGMDASEFRREMETAVQHFRDAGETGKPMLEQIAKIERRIDTDDDGSCTDGEILRFLSKKVRILELG